MNILQRLATSTFYQEHNTDGTHSSITATTATFNNGITVNEAGADSDTRIESDTNSNMFVLDASQNNIGIGGAPVDYAVFDIGGSFTSGGASTQVEGLLLNPALTAATGDTTRHTGALLAATITTQGATETISDIAQLMLAEPNITVGSGDTVTRASTLTIISAPTEGGTHNAAIWIQTGNIILDDDGNGDPQSGTGTLFLGEGQDLELYHDGTNSYIVNNTGDLYIGDAGTDDVILSNNGGKVGIGTATPAELVEISHASDATLMITDTTTPTSMKIVVNNNDGFVRTSTNHPLNLGTNATTAMTIDTSQNVGIGTTSPGALLDVDGDAIFNESGADKDFRIESANNANMFFVDASQDNIGIGAAPGSINFFDIGGSFTSDGAGSVANLLYLDGTLTGATGDTVSLSAATLTGNITTQGATETITTVAQLYLDEPSITVGTGDTVTNATTLFIASAPTEGGTANAAILIGSGNIVLDHDGNGNMQSGAGTLFLGESQDLELYHDGVNSYIMNNTGDLYIGDAGTDDVILSNNGGKVGIGTTSPDGTLHVHTATAGAVTAAAAVDNLVIEDSGHSGMTIFSGSTSQGGLYFGDVGGNTRGWWIYNHNGDSMNMGTAGGTRMTIDSSGNVGIGTAAPRGVLDVQGSSTLYLGVTGATHGYIRSDDSIYISTDYDNNGSTGHILFTTNAEGTELMRIQDDGKVGIGTATPDQMLHVLETSAGTVTAPAGAVAVLERSGAVYLQLLTNTTGQGGISWGDPDDVDVGRLYYLHSSNAMQFVTNAAERMRIDSAGNVGIGTASPDEPLHVAEAVDGVTTALVLENSTAHDAGTNEAVQMLFGFGGSNDAGAIRVGKTSDYQTGAAKDSFMSFYTEENDATTEHMRITAQGDVGINDTTPNAQLHVASRHAAVVGLRVDTAATPSADAVEVYANATESLSITAKETADLASAITLAARDMGDGSTNRGAYIYLGRNTNGTNQAAGHAYFVEKDGGAAIIWPDATGDLRINSSVPYSGNDTAGTVVGTQSSWIEQKKDIEPWNTYDEALATVVNTPLYTFKLKETGHKTYDEGEPTFYGLVIDEDDRKNDAWFAYNLAPNQVPTLDDRSIYGYLIASIKALEARIKELETN